MISALYVHISVHILILLCCYYQVNTVSYYINIDTILLMKITNKMNFFFFLWRCDPTRVMASSFLRFLDHTQRRTTVGRTPLDEWSALRRDVYLTTHNTQTNIHAPGGIRTHDLSRRAAADLRLRPRAHCDRPRRSVTVLNCTYYIFTPRKISFLGK